MKNIKTFKQLFENASRLKPSKYWIFTVFFTDERIGSTRVARFLVSGGSSREITTRFLENLLPQYLGFDSLYTLSPNIAPPEIDDFMGFGGWIYQNIDEISDRAGLGKIYVRGIEAHNNIDFPEFLGAFEGEESIDEYTEMDGDPNHLAWMIVSYLKNNREIERIFEFFNEYVGNTVRKDNHSLKIGEKYSDVIDAMLDSEDCDFIYDYFKKNPLELSIVEIPRIKQKILGKTGIDDYSKLGKGLKSGLI